MWKIRQKTFVSSFRFVEEKKKENYDNCKAFCVTHKRNKNLNFIPTFKTNKQKIHIEMESFFRFVKLKAYLKVQYNEKVNTEDQIFKLKTTKNVHLIKIIAPSKHILKQRKGNLNNGDISDNNE